MSAHQAIRIESAAGGRTSPAWLAAPALVALYLWVVCWPVIAPDMTLFLFPWYGHILEQGPVGAFAEPFSNYSPPYLYLLAAGSLAKSVLSPLSVIKLVAVAGTMFLAAAVADLLKALGGDWRRGLAVFLLPTVIVNAALLGQCDALWAGASVLGIAAMIRGRTVAALVWCGVAIAFKAQSAFVTPFILGALVGRRAPLWQWLIPPAVYCVMMIPAWAAGWPAGDLAMIYVRQVEYFDFPGNLANPWIWATRFAPASQNLYPLGYVAAALAALGVGAAVAASVRKPAALLALATISTFALPYLLPKMHERYLFLADVLALALALARPTRATVLAAIGVQLTSLSALLAYIYKWPVLALAGAWIGGATLVLLLVIAKMEGARLR